jgi:hypothetical protein
MPASRSYAEKHVNALRALCKCGCKGGKDLINACEKEHIYAICECAENLLIGRVPLTESQKTRLRKHKKAMLHLADTSIGWRKKKKLIQQKGSGLLTTILGVALPALIGLFAKK